MSEQALKKLFARHFGEPPVAIAPLKGDASARRLYRLRAPSRTAIGVVGPDDRENRAFLEFSRHFKTCGLPVPEIYADHIDEGIYLEEDLGDTTLFHSPRKYLTFTGRWSKSSRASRSRLAAH
jgi:aminoglycoside/choline kinase family phosphotransferase